MGDGQNRVAGAVVDGGEMVVVLLAAVTDGLFEEPRNGPRRRPIVRCALGWPGPPRRPERGQGGDEVVGLITVDAGGEVDGILGEDALEGLGGEKPLLRKGSRMRTRKSIRDVRPGALGPLCDR